MVQPFLSFCERHTLIQPGNRVLLAVSGGVDSVVMTRLFADAGYPFALAHVNFRLRGEESDLDELFVQEMATHYAVPFFCERFDTATHATKKGISVQMAARELRYRWFEEIRASAGYDLIATAHHRDDQIETFFIHLLRGSGIAGLHGIPLRQGPVIRPLLFASREEIAAFASENALSFREDSSNAKTTYLRNKIRHDLLPVIASIQPGYAGTITNTISHIRDAEALLLPYVEATASRLFDKQGDGWTIPVDALLELKPLHAWLYSLFSPFGFNAETLKSLAEHLTGESGLQFFSPEYRIVKDRNQLILIEKTIPRTASEEKEIHISETVREILSPVHLTFRPSACHDSHQISHNPHVASIDAKHLQYPLILRRWRMGDTFHPFGMNQRKKLSDFFIDEKLSLPEKESVWVLCTGERIVWVVGYRIDDRFRIGPETRSILTIHYQRQENPEPGSLT